MLVFVSTLAKQMVCRGTVAQVVMSWRLMAAVGAAGARLCTSESEALKICVAERRRTQHVYMEMF